jgi:hypothetical protein
MGNKNTSSKNISRAHQVSNSPPSVGESPQPVALPEFSKQYAPFDLSLCDNAARGAVLEAMSKPLESFLDKRCPIHLPFLQQNENEILVVKSQQYAPNVSFLLFQTLIEHLYASSFEGLYTVGFLYKHPSAGDLIRPLGVIYNGKYFCDLYKASREVFVKQTPPWHESENSRKHQIALNWVQDVVSVFHSSHYVAEATPAFSLPEAPKFHPMIAEEAVETAMNMTASLSVYVSVWLSFNQRKGTRLYMQDQWEFKMFDGAFIGANLSYGMQFEVNDSETEIIKSSLVYRGNLRVAAFEETKAVSLGASEGLGFSKSSIKCEPFRGLKMESSTKINIGDDMSGSTTTVKILWNGNQFNRPHELLPQLLQAEGWSDLSKRPKLASNFCLSVVERFNDQHRRYVGPSSPLFQLLDFPYSEPVISTVASDGSIHVKVFHSPRAGKDTGGEEEEKEVFLLSFTFSADGSLTASDETLFAVVSKGMHILHWLHGVDNGAEPPRPKNNEPKTWV